MLTSTFAFLNSENNTAYTSPEKFVIFSPDHHELYVAAYKMFLDKPILGHGHDMYYKNCGKFKRSASSCSTHPHNTFLQFAVETGFIGFTFFDDNLFIFNDFIFFKSTKKNLNRNKKFYFKNMFIVDNKC